MLTNRNGYPSGSHKRLNLIEAGDETRTRNPQLGMERETGIEPATPGLGSRCSTIELLALKPLF